VMGAHATLGGQIKRAISMMIGLIKLVDQRRALLRSGGVFSMTLETIFTKYFGPHFCLGGQRWYSHANNMI